MTKHDEMRFKYFIISYSRRKKRFYCSEQILKGRKAVVPKEKYKTRKSRSKATSLKTANEDVTTNSLTLTTRSIQIVVNII